MTQAARGVPEITIQHLVSYSFLNCIIRTAVLCHCAASETPLYWGANFCFNLWGELRLDVVLSLCRACCYGSIPEVFHHCGWWAVNSVGRWRAACGQWGAEPSHRTVPNNADLQGFTEETLQLWEVPGLSHLSRFHVPDDRAVSMRQHLKSGFIIFLMWELTLFNLIKYQK